MKKLLVITSKPNEEIIEKENNLKTTNKPYTRQKKILDKLQSTFPDQTFMVRDDSISDMRKYLNECCIVDEQYLEFLENAYTNFVNNGENPEYISPYDGGLINYHFSKKNIMVPSDLPYYLQCGIYGDDLCTSIFSYTYESSLKSTINCIAASEILSNNSLNEIFKKYIGNDIIYCLNVFPGHHATHCSYSGYCFLNNAAICAQLLSQTHDLVAILDLDFHHGDGTQKIFYKNNCILTISIHGDPNNNYPFYSGYENEHGKYEAVGYNINYALKNGCGKDEYIKTLTDALSIINRYKIDVLVIAFGADTCMNDPEGNFGLGIDDYLLVGQLIKSQINVPMVVTQEGGYCMDVVDMVVTNFLNGLL
ncbi:MAG: acetylpolyamine aminohydrolase [Satyrvirus sp.]|uniref:Acetylpolyamine aminohydrolase n=1 Tax=Satyrvirus sp. TaxID=2487771 RepID=A0A3G5ADZ8_9VIRU|nr:MAG: acetylpolyamine aminohydrolase [Satyrvirus sp.]